jgi:hypothetical protein
VPQDPADASFASNDLRLLSGDARPKIEVLLDGDNLGAVLNGDSATLTVLGLDVAVDAATVIRASSAIEDEDGPELEDEDGNEDETETEHGQEQEDEQEQEDD